MSVCDDFVVVPVVSDETVIVVLSGFGIVVWDVCVVSAWTEVS